MKEKQKKSPLANKITYYTLVLYAVCDLRPAARAGHIRTAPGPALGLMLVEDLFTKSPKFGQREELLSNVGRCLYAVVLLPHCPMPSFLFYIVLYMQMWRPVWPIWCGQCRVQLWPLRPHVAVL